MRYPCLPQSIVAGALAALCALSATAQNFPIAGKPVRWIVPFPPGGATDALARPITDRLSALWKVPVVIENKPGANTAIGTDTVAKSAPDGHVLGMVTLSHIMNPLLGASLPYDTLKDLVGVTQMTELHMALYAHRDLPANTPAEFLALAKKQAGKLQYGSATTASYLGMELFNMMAGIKMEYIPYKGSAPAITDTMAGRLALIIDPVLNSTLSLVKDGRLKIIGTMGTTRASLTPDAPLMGDVVPGFVFSSNFGLVTQGATPPELVRRLRDDIVGVIKQPEISARIRELGQEPYGSTVDEYNNYIRAEMKRWAPVVKATGAKLE
jgi:tripartite-type tricarboxylate transporter receptor subunit TctC